MPLIISILTLKINIIIILPIRLSVELRKTTVFLEASLRIVIKIKILKPEVEEI